MCSIQRCKTYFNIIPCVVCHFRSICFFPWKYTKFTNFECTKRARIDHVIIVRNKRFGWWNGSNQTSATHFGWIKALVALLQAAHGIFDPTHLNRQCCLKEIIKTILFWMICLYMCSWTYYIRMFIDDNQYSEPKIHMNCFDI